MPEFHVFYFNDVSAEPEELAVSVEDSYTNGEDQVIVYMSFTIVFLPWYEGYSMMYKLLYIDV